MAFFEGNNMTGGYGKAQTLLILVLLMLKEGK